MVKQHYARHWPSSRTVLWSIVIIVLFIIFSIFTLLLLGPVTGNVYSNIVSNLPANQYPSDSHSFPVKPIKRLIIRDGSITMVVEDSRAAKKSIEQMVAEMENEGAFVVSSTEQGSMDNRSPDIRMEIRVPSTRFDEVMNRLAGMALDVRERTETAQDVTEEYVDLQGRLEALEGARKRLLEIMKDAKTTEELLQAEQQLTQREAELESIKGRIEYLTQSAALSKINIILQPYFLNQPFERGWRPAETARQAFEMLVNSGLGFANFLIYFGIAVLPWLVLIGLIVYGVVRLRKRYARKNLTKETTPTSSPEE